MTIHDVVQRSEAWRAIRLGLLTGSCAADMMAMIKTGEAASRRNLRTRLVLERLTGVADETYQSFDMKRGAEMESEAITEYEARTNRIVQSVGFVTEDSVAAGCSPDGFVVGGGMVEAKCPKAATHLGYLRTRVIPREYLYQCIHNMWVTGQPWIDFLSYHPAFPADLRLIVTRLCSSKELASYNLAARMFLAEVDRELAELQAMQPVEIV